MTDIEKFVKKITELQEEHEKRPFTSEELRKIAESLGMSDDDWARIQEEAGDYRTRGVGYLRHGLWPEAVKEFEQALILLPADAIVLCGLVEGYTNIFLQGHRDDDKRKAFLYGTQCLDVQPGNQSVFRQLAKIRNEEQAQVVKTRQNRVLKETQLQNPKVEPPRAFKKEPPQYPPMGYPPDIEEERPQITNWILPLILGEEQPENAGGESKSYIGCILALTAIIVVMWILVAKSC